MYAKLTLDKIIHSKSGKSFGKSKEKFSLGIVELFTFSLVLVPETRKAISSGKNRFFQCGS